MPTPIFHRRLAHLQSPLHPFLSITTGTPHPAFPATLLHFHLLSETQLDCLAHFYHQRTPSDPFRTQYPAPLERGRWKDGIGGVEAKRRRFGRFVGLRGCESPLFAGLGHGSEGGPDADVEKGTQREVEAWVEREMRRLNARVEEDEIWRRKNGIQKW